MYLLPCPHCQASIPVSAAQAGGELKCPGCGAAVAAPKLGELRQLPRDASAGAETNAAAARETSFAGGRAVWISLGVIATVSLLIAGFCGIRWALIDVPLDTEQHIAELTEQYHALTTAELIREWEQMERYGLDLPIPYAYQQLAVEKRSWGINTVVAGTLGLVCLLIAAALARAGRPAATAPQGTP